jgi:hypothetical protein
MSSLFTSISRTWRPQGQLRPFQILILALIRVLLRIRLLSQNCLAAVTHLARTVIESVNNSMNASDSNGACRSYCFCCHFVAVAAPLTGARHSLKMTSCRATEVSGHFNYQSVLSISLPEHSSAFHLNFPIT